MIRATGANVTLGKLTGLQDREYKQTCVVPSNMLRSNRMVRPPTKARVSRDVLKLGRMESAVPASHLCHSDTV